jgi:NADPH2 dehydrogenase
MSEKHAPKYSRIAQLKTPADFTNYLSANQISLPFDTEVSPQTAQVFAKKITLKSGRTIGNSLCILPMEGWDGTTTGQPTQHTHRRWHNFAISGAKLLFGCEAVAIRPDARANPNQLYISDQNLPHFASLYQNIIQAHYEKYGDTSDLLVGLQLTHSGRFCKPNNHSTFESRTAYSHPVLDPKFGCNQNNILTDSDIDQLIADYIKAAVLAQKAGFHFVDIKHCHGYLGHELLSAYTRPGIYGGSFQNRSRYLRNIATGIKAAAPGLELAIRLSAFDYAPFQKDQNQIGQPAVSQNYQYAFGGDGTGTGINLAETKQFMALAQELGIQMLCITAASPYYNPHLMRPAIFPPSDGYLPPEEPLLGVARQIQVTAQLKKAFPELIIIGSAYSYLQEWLPHVAQNVLRNGLADSIGFGRMVLSYPTMPHDMLTGQPSQRKLICRTFSDCTTAPRNGLISGCYPLDPHYKTLAQAEQLKAIKEKL